SDKNLYKLFFVEVSYGPFHQDPEPHIDDDKKKLEKLELWNIRSYLSHIFYSLNSLNDSETVTTSKETIATFPSPSRIPTRKNINFK
ncbi:19291_t:CDS:2, partial [Gigaspora rosea]